jgi:four helix bundle protein
MCYVFTERDVRSRVMYPSDVMCAARVKRNTSHHCDRRERHHCAAGTTSLARQGIHHKRRGNIMSGSKLRELSMGFSVQIIELVKNLKTQHESVISNQIGRSGTSVGANNYEAKYAQGKKDFISKLEIALKEASETGYWLELLHRTNYIDDEVYCSLNDQCALIRVLLVSSCKTAKKNMND